MGKIALITEPKLIGTKSIGELQKQMPNETITMYASVQKLINDDENGHPNAVIMDTNKNFLRAKDYFCNEDVKIAVWMSEFNKEHLKELFSFGFDGYFICGMSTDEIAIGIKTILKGRNYIHPKLTSLIFHHSDVI